MLDDKELMKRYKARRASGAFEPSQQAPSTQTATSGRGSGRGGITALLSEAGGLGGAALGTALLPGVGTVIGGGLGALFGKLGENKIRDDEFRVGEALTEGALGTLGGGLRGLKAVGSAGKTLAKKPVGTAVTKEADDLARWSKMGAITPDDAKYLDANRAAIGATQEAAAPSRLAAARQASIDTYNAPRKGVLARMGGDTAKQTDMRSAGIQIGGTLRGKVIDDDYANELYDFARNRSSNYITGGVKSGKPLTQAKQANEAFNGVKTALSTKLDEINRPLVAGEADNIAVTARQKLAGSLGMGDKKTPILDDFERLLKKADNKDIKALEGIRRQADDLAYKLSGDAKTTTEARQALAVRDAIDEFVTPFSDEYKAIKGDYSIARDLKDLASKGSKAADKSIQSSQNIIGAITGGQTAQGAKSKVAGIFTPGAPVTDNFSKKEMGGLAARVLGARSLAGVGSPEEQPMEGELSPEEVSSLLDLSTQEAPAPEEDTSSPYALANVEMNVQRILEQGGTEKDVAAYLNNVEAFNAFRPAAAATKPKSAESAKVSGIVASGLDSLGRLQEIINTEGVPKGTIAPGRGLFGGAGQAVLGTAEYDAAADNIADAMVRLRTGAAATKEELALYRRLLPQAFDSPEVQAQKMQQVQDYFANIQGSTGGAATDLQSQLGM